MRERASRLIAMVKGALPRGGSLPEETWRARHRVNQLIILLHIPVVFAVASGRKQPLTHASIESVPLLVCAVLGLVGSRSFRSLVSTLGLMTASGVLVHLTGGLIELHFHFFAMLGIIALYQDWKPMLFAVGFVLVHHGLLGSLDPEGVYNHPAAIASPWKWAGIHGGLVMLASSTLFIFWRRTEQATEQATEARREVAVRDQVLEELRRAEEVKDQLIASVSHEFRTPVTAIIGCSDSLARLGDRLDNQMRLDLVHRIERQSRRLARLVQNVLTTSRVVAPDVGARADVGVVLSEALEEVVALPEAEGVPVLADPPFGLNAAICPDALHQIIVNLVSNAMKFGTPGMGVAVQIDRVSGMVRLSVINSAHAIAPKDRERIFEPFVQLDGSDTRTSPGVGLGLHVVRQLATAFGGDVVLESHDELIIFTVCLLESPVHGSGSVQQSVVVERRAG